MRKILYLVITAIMAMISSCNSQQPLATTVKGENPLSFSVEGKTIRAELVGNATTGYTWKSTITKGDKNVKLVSDNYSVPQREDGSVIMGQPGKHTFVFEATGHGKATIVFDYAQHWNKGQTGGIRTIEVVIDEELKPTVNEKL